MRSARRTSARGEARRAQILEGALAAIRERAIADVQLSSIAEHAGLKPSHLLYYFPSRDDVLIAAVAYAEHKLAEGRSERLRTLTDPADRLAAYVTAYLPDDRHDPVWKLWIEGWLRSASRDGFAVVGTDANAGWRTDLVEALEYAIETSDAALTENTIAFARRFNYFLDGLAVHVLANHISVTEARAAARRALKSELRSELRIDCRTDAPLATGAPSDPLRSAPVGRREETRKRRRESILSAVTDAIASHGVRGMRLEQVAAAAGVSAPLLYYHFENREELVLAALEFAHERAPSTGLLAKIPADAIAYELLETALLAELDEDPDVRQFSIVWGELSAVAVFDPTVRPYVRQVCASWSDKVSRTIEFGIADGSIAGDTDPESAAEILSTLVDGLCARWLAGVLELDQARGLLQAALERHLRPR